MRLSPFTLAITLLALCCLSTRARSADVDIGRFASLVSRDSKLFVWVGEREACVRRARRTELVRAVEELGSAPLTDGTCDALSRLSLFLSPTLVAAVPDALRTSAGSMALSVEGFVLQQGVPRPDVLIVADIAGFDPLVGGLLSLAKGDDAARTRLADAGLPFEVADDPPPRIVRVGDVEVCDLHTAAGDRLAIGSHRGLLLAARSVARIEKVLERMANRAYGTLLDSPRFTRTVREVSLRPGHLFAYVNLRRIRQEEAFHLAEAGVLRDFLMNGFDGYDGLGVAVRGVGDAFAARLFLEQGRDSRRAGPALLRENKALRYASSVTPPLGGVFSLRWTGPQAGDFLLGITGLAGSPFTGSRLERAFASYGGRRRFEALASQLDGEFTLIQPRGVVAGENIPRFAFQIDVRSPRRVADWFERLVVESDSRLVRQVDLRDQTYYELRIPGNNYLSAMAFAVVGDRLIGATNLLVLRSMLGTRGPAEVTLGATDDFHAPFDRLDIDPTTAECSGQGYLDTRRLAEAASTWLSGLYQVLAVTDVDESMLDLVHELVTLCDDPVFQDALAGAGFHAWSVDGGVVIEAAGP